MALEKNIKINVDTKGAVAETDKLTKSFKEVDAQAGKTSKSVDDVASNGGAIAVLDNLTGGLATRFKDAYEATKLFNLSLKGMRTALIATGIGALIVALGLVVAYWDEIEEAVTGVKKRTEEYLDLSRKQTGVLDANLSLLDKQIESAKLQGKATDSLQKQKKTLIKQSKALNLQQRSILQTQIARLKAVQQEITLTDVLGAAWAFVKGGTVGVSREAQDIAIKRQKEIADLELALKSAQIAGTELEITLFKINNPEAVKEKEENVKPPEILGTGGIFENTDVLDAKAGRIQEFYKQVEETDATYWLGVAERQILEVERQAQADIEELRALGAHKDLIADIERQAQEKVSSIARKAAEDRGKATSKTEIKWTELTAAQKLAITGSLLGDLAGLVDKNSIAGKGIAIAQTGINTAQGIMQAFATLPTVPAIVAAALVGATGVSQIIKITKTKIPSATGSGFVGGGVGGGGGAPKPPAFNLVQGTKSNQIADSVQSGTQPVKAYVTSKDVTSRQEMDRNIEGGASL